QVFIFWANTVCLIVVPVAFLAHLLISDARKRGRAGLEQTVWDFVRLVAVMVFINAGHIVAFGWPLGFPLPGPVLQFLPFIAGVFLVWVAGVTALGCVALLFLSSRSQPEEAEET